MSVVGYRFWVINFKIIIKTKSFDLAVAAVGCYNYLVAEKKEFVLNKQFLRPSTSVGGNVRKAINAQSKADFIHKLLISQKECDETMYWLKLLKETNDSIDNESNSSAKQCSFKNH